MIIHSELYRTPFLSSDDQNLAPVQLATDLSHLLKRQLLCKPNNLTVPLHPKKKNNLLKLGFEPRFSSRWEARTIELSLGPGKDQVRPLSSLLGAGVFDHYTT